MKSEMTKEKLYRMYWIKGITKSDICFGQGICPKTLAEMFRKWDIPSRRVGYRFRKEGEKI